MEGKGGRAGVETEGGHLRVEASSHTIVGVDPTLLAAEAVGQLLRKVMPGGGEDHIGR